MLALPIFPGRLQPSIVGRSELNFRVRDGNGWTLALISTNCCIATVLYSNKPLSNCQVVPSGTFKRFAQQNLAAGRIHSARGSRRNGVPAGWDIPWGAPGYGREAEELSVNAETCAGQRLPRRDWAHSGARSEITKKSGDRPATGPRIFPLRELVHSSGV